MIKQTDQLTFIEKQKSQFHFYYFIIIIEYLIYFNLFSPNVSHFFFFAFIFKVKSDFKIKQNSSDRSKKTSDQKIESNLNIHQPVI